MPVIYRLSCSLHRVICLLLAVGLAGQGAAESGSGMIHGGNPPEYPSGGYQHAKMHLDQLKGAWGWLGAEEKDAAGYPMRLRPGGPAVSRILYLDPGMTGIAPYAGGFRLYGRGQGEIAISARPDAGTEEGRRSHPEATVLLAPTTTAALPRETRDGTDYWYADFTYDPAQIRDPVQLEIRALPVPGDRPRAMALVHRSHLADWRAGARFMPEVIADLSVLGHQQARTGAGRGALRLMQQMQANLIWRTDGTNFLTQTPAQRERRFVGTDHYSYVKRQNDGPERTQTFIATALPVEDAVALANATGMDLWYNLPADVSDDRARAIGMYVRDHLDPPLRVFWEYGNEMWNKARGFNSHAYALALGQQTFPRLKGLAAVAEWDVYRSMQLFAILRDVFAEIPARARFVASFWAFDASNTPEGDPIATSYAGRYFAARHARRRSDFTALPEEIITDMAVGGYFGATSPALLKFLQGAWPDDAMRAAALAQVLTAGMDGNLVTLSPSALRRPVTGVSPNAPIGAFALLRRDIDQGGLDPIGGLADVLRLQGNTLQYRGLRSPRWRSVLEFTTPPKHDLSEMLRQGQLSAAGRMIHGRPREGYAGQLRNALAGRVQAHAAFARAYGVDLLFYEGGMGGNGQPGTGERQGRSFVQEFHLGGAAAGVMRDFIARAAPDVRQMLWYKTHTRSFHNGWRGLKEYYGQPGTQAPKWQLIEDQATQQGD